MSNCMHWSRLDERDMPIARSWSYQRRRMDDKSLSSKGKSVGSGGWSTRPIRPILFFLLSSITNSWLFSNISFRNKTSKDFSRVTMRLKSSSKVGISLSVPTKVKQSWTWGKNASKQTQGLWHTKLIYWTQLSPLKYYLYTATTPAQHSTTTFHHTALQHQSLHHKNTTKIPL